METPEITERFNAATYLLDRHVAEGRGGRPALVCKGRTFTYADVLTEVNKLGNALLAAGIEMENRVFLLMPDIPELVYGLLAAMKIGAVPVGANTLLPKKDFEYILGDSRAKLAIVHETLAAQVIDLMPTLPHLKKLIIVGAMADGGFETYDSFIRGASGQLEAADTSRNDSAVWQYTSGTTGAPKGIIQMHKAIPVHNEAFAKKVLGMNENDRILSLAKLFFGYGQGNSLYMPFGSGACTILMPERPEPATIAELVTKERPTIFCGVPTAYNALLDLPGLTEKYDFRSVRLCTSAGEALPPAVLDRWMKTWGIEIIDGIGSTECYHIFIANRQGKVIPGSLGKPLDGVEVKLLDDDGNPAAQGDIGNIYVKSGFVASSYWNKHELTQKTFQGEWVKTGDKFTVDSNGDYWFAGRGDDMIKSGGIWVAPIEVEACLGLHPAVLECGVVGAPDPDNLIKPKAYVVLRNGFEASETLTRELQAHVKAKLAPYKYPRWIAYVTELPKTATGKVQRFKLRQLNG